MASFLHVQLLEEEYTFQAPFIGFVEEFCRIQILQESFQFFPLRRRIGVRFQNYVTLLRNVSIHVDFGGKLELQPIKKNSFCLRFLHFSWDLYIQTIISIFLCLVIIYFALAFLSKSKSCVFFYSFSQPHVSKNVAISYPFCKKKMHEEMR